MSDPLNEQIKPTIAERGWADVHYAPRAGSDDAPERFSYTVGVSKVPGWPEIIVCGLDADKARTLLTNTLAECWQDKGPPHAGMTLDRVIQGRSIRVTSFPGGETRHFHFADVLAKEEGRRPPVRVQLLWPDRDGHFPGDAECDAGIAAAQLFDTV